MKTFRFIFSTILLFIFFLNIALAESNIAFVNLEKILTESKAGKSMASQINAVNKKNLTNYNKIEEKLKKEDKSLTSKKNILSKEDYQKELNILKANVAKYQQERAVKIKKASKAGMEATSKILNLINPILAKYAKDNDISIIMDKKNIIMGKTELDITNEVLKIIDKEVKPFTVK